MLAMLRTTPDGLRYHVDYHTPGAAAMRLGQMAGSLGDAFVREPAALQSGGARHRVGEKHEGSVQTFNRLTSSLSPSTTDCTTYSAEHAQAHTVRGGLT
jgi:hypothetical protein